MLRLLQKGGVNLGLVAAVLFNIFFVHVGSSGYFGYWAHCRALGYFNVAFVLQSFVPPAYAKNSAVAQVNYNPYRDRRKYAAYYILFCPRTLPERYAYRRYRYYKPRRRIYYPRLHRRILCGNKLRCAHVAEFVPEGYCANGVALLGRRYVRYVGNGIVRLLIILIEYVHVPVSRHVKAFKPAFSLLNQFPFAVAEARKRARIAHKRSRVKAMRVARLPFKEHALALHNNAVKAQLPVLHGAGKVHAGIGYIAGFYAYYIVAEAGIVKTVAQRVKHAVAVAETECLAPLVGSGYSALPRGYYFAEGIVLHGVAAKLEHIVGGYQLRYAAQPMRVNVMRACHAKLGGLFVHPTIHSVR